MPFTPSHAIVALPFVRTPLVPAAIAIGAMAPDLPLFLRVGIPVGGYRLFHDVRYLAVTVLLALALSLVWRLVLRPATRQLLPSGIARRLPAEWDQGTRTTVREMFGGVRPVVMLVVSLALGVLSHILWDAFSHEGRAGVTLVPALDATWGALPGYKWVQYVSGIGGVVVLAVWALLWLRRAPVSRPTRVVPAWVGNAWLAALPVILVVAVVLGLVTQGPLSATFTVQHLAYATLPPACGVWGVLTLVICVVVGGRRATATGVRTTMFRR